MCSPSIPSVKEPDPLPTPVDEAVIDEMKDRRRRSRLRAGSAGTILTSGSGLDDEPTTAKATLLGG